MSKCTISIPKMQAKKSRSLLLAASFNRLGQTDKSIRCRECGTFVEVTTMTDGNERITAANFCKERLCPLCNWRRSARIYSNTSRILDHLDAQDKEHKYLFLTLTVRNCEYTDLGHTLDNMAAAFNRLCSNRAWKNRVLGAMRTTEVTINRETRTAHPHYHLILMVPRSYGTKGDKLYWTQQDWMAAWRKAARLDYNPNTWIERVKGGKSEGVEEMSKYLAKDADYITDDQAETDELVQLLDEHLKGRRLISYTGALKRAAQDLRIKDAEDGDLVDRVRGDLVKAIKHYHWNAGLARYTPRKEEKYR